MFLVVSVGCDPLDDGVAGAPPGIGGGGGDSGGGCGSPGENAKRFTFKVGLEAVVDVASCYLFDEPANDDPGFVEPEFDPCLYITDDDGYVVFKVGSTETMCRAIGAQHPAPRVRIGWRW